MKMFRFAAFAVAIATAAMLIGSAGAGTGTSVPTVDLSTDQAVVSYLTSLGIDPTGAVIQRGALNYAGPSCPGAGWTCTSSTKVVQVAEPGGQNQVACGAGANVIPDSYLTTNLTQNQVNQLVASAAVALPVSTCAAVQAGGAQTNTFRCVRRESPEPTTSQDCVIVQPGTGDDASASNRAFVLEIVDQSTGPNQQATQSARIQHTTLAGAQNFVHVIQSIKQATKIGTSQTQEGDQLTCELQSSEQGSEFSQVIQSLAQKEQAQGSPAQNQNVTPQTKTCDAPAITSTANTFAGVEQDSGSGALESHVNQSHNLDARATNATSGTQTQGAPPPDGGMQGKVFQNSSGTAKSFGLQNEDQSLAGNSPTIVQKQFGPLTCCSTQFDNPNDNVKIDQMSSQAAVTSSFLLGDLTTAIPNPNALQETLLQGTFETSGDGQITHKAKQNEGSDTASCPPGEISSEGTTSCSLTTFGLNGVFFAEFPPPCPEGEFFNPTTGQCEGEIG
jgi:hypothetical protein